MDFFEAMEKMKLGKKIKLKSWPANQFIGLQEQEVTVFGAKKIKYSAIDSEGCQLAYSIPFSTLVSLEWELFDEYRTPS